jgi:beta-glucanase (GH16 family)
MVVVGGSAGSPGALTVTAAGALPAAPTNVTSIAKDAAATVSWVPSGSPGVSSYTVTPYIGGSAQTPTTVSAPASSATVTGLTNGTSYTFTVKASNASGAGPESAASGSNLPQANLLWGDEFNGSVIDPAWAVLTRDSDQSNSELGFYLPAQVALDGSGNLQIQTTNTSFTGATYSDVNYPANNGNVTRSYRSGMVQWSTFNVVPASGKTVSIKFSAKMPAGVGSGIWPGSGWLLGANCEQTNKLNPDNVDSCSWPNPGSDEIDIAEFGIGGGGNLTTANASIHSNSGTSGPGSYAVSDASAAFHVYEVDWSLSTVTWKYDGVSQGSTATGVPQNAMFFIFNVTVAGSVGASFPQTMLVDYLRVFSA